MVTLDQYRRILGLREGKLRLTASSGLLVMRAWPPSAVWRDTPAGPWRHCRPGIFDLKAREPLARCRFALATCADAPAAWLDQFEKSRLEPPPDSVLVGILRELRALASRPPDPPRQADSFADAVSAVEELCTYAEFLRAVPRPVRDAVAPFAQRHYSLCSLAARVDGGLDLVRSTGPLAFMLANSWVFRPAVAKPLRSARSLVRKKQRDQLAWLGVEPSTTAVIRILRKVPPECCTAQTLLYLRDAVKIPRARHLLAHIDRINAGVVLFVSHPRLLPFAEHSLLDDVSKSSDEDVSARMGHKTLDLLDRFEAEGRRVPRLRDLHQIRELLVDEDLGVTFQRHVEALCRMKYPEPPVRGNHVVQPICTSAELEQEGARQQHCIFSYGEDIARGRAYAYHVATGNGGATVLLRRSVRFPGTWRVDEIRGPGNAPPTAEASRAVAEWMDPVAHACEAYQYWLPEIEVDFEPDDIEKEWD